MDFSAGYSATTSPASEEMRFTSLDLLSRIEVIFTVMQTNLKYTDNVEVITLVNEAIGYVSGIIRTCIDGKCEACKTPLNETLHKGMRDIRATFDRTLDAFKWLYVHSSSTIMDLIIWFRKQHMDCPQPRLYELLIVSRKINQHMECRTFVPPKTVDASPSAIDTRAKRPRLIEGPQLEGVDVKITSTIVAGKHTHNLVIEHPQSVRINDALQWAGNQLIMLAQHAESRPPELKINTVSSPLAGETPAELIAGLKKDVENANRRILETARHLRAFINNAQGRSLTNGQTAQNRQTAQNGQTAPNITQIIASGGQTQPPAQPAQPPNPPPAPLVAPAPLAAPSPFTQTAQPPAQAATDLWTTQPIKNEP